MRTGSTHQILCVILTLYSLALVAPRQPWLQSVVDGGLPFQIHVIHVGILSMTTLINRLIFPTARKDGKGQLHMLVGRISLISNVVGFSLSLAVSYLTDTEQSLFHFTNWHFLIAVGQLGFQSMGYTSIKRYQRLKVMLEECEKDPQEKTEGARLRLQLKEALRSHVICMGGLLVFGCASPAIVQISSRLLHVLDLPWLLFAPVSFFLLLALIRPFFHWGDEWGDEDSVVCHKGEEIMMPLLQVV